LQQRNMQLPPAANMTSTRRLDNDDKTFITSTLPFLLHRCIINRQVPNRSRPCFITGPHRRKTGFVRQSRKSLTIPLRYCTDAVAFLTTIGA